MTDETPEPEYESIRRTGGDGPGLPDDADEPEYESIRRPGGQDETSEDEAQPR